MATNRDPKEGDSNWRKSEIPEGVLDSEALRINLEETGVEQVAVDPKYNVLQEVVAGYRGIQKTVEACGPPTDTGSQEDPRLWFAGDDGGSSEKSASGPPRSFRSGG